MRTDTSGVHDHEMLPCCKAETMTSISGDIDTTHLVTVDIADH